MRLTFKEFGMTELAARLSSRVRFSALAAEFMSQLGADMLVSVKEKTPVLSGNLVESETLVYYQDVVVITSPVAYAPFIEGGERNDPRVSANPVRRRAGGAFMFARTAQEFKTFAASRVQDLWKTLSSIWTG